MDDAELLRLFSERSERAVAETELKYGGLCQRLAQRILENTEDAEKCVNDALLQAWNSIPPECPESLAAYLNTLTRNIALSRLIANNRLWRGSGSRLHDGGGICLRNVP